MREDLPGLLYRLRVIHLFEANYNFVTGLIFGHRALYSSIANETLHASQWAKPGRQYKFIRHTLGWLIVTSLLC
jgi:hypothetical protein